MTSALLAGVTEAARTAPHRAALLTSGRPPLTFGMLRDRIDNATAGLCDLGVAQGMRTALLVPPGPDFVVCAFALLACGAVPVLVDPGIGVRRIGRALAGVRPEAFVGSPRAHAARRLLRWAPTARVLVVADAPRGLTSRARDRHAVALAGLEHQGARTRAGMGDRARTQPDDREAALLFTSGSTGPPKAVVYRHPHFAAQLAALCGTYGLRAGEVNIATFAPFALFGPAIGMTTVLPEMDFTRPASADPARLFGDVRAHQAAVLFASPALLAVLAEHGISRRSRLPSLRLVLSAGAPVPVEVARATASLLAPDALVATPYGMTEALPVCSIAGPELLDTATAQHPPRGVCVGRPVRGTDVAVVEVTDEALDDVTGAALLPDGVVGELVVAGPQVTEAYAGSPAATRHAKARWNGRIAHRTGDLGWRDGQGRLWFCGRVVHRVRTAAGWLDPLPVEQLVLTHPSVCRAAVVAVDGEAAPEPVLVVQPRRDWWSATRLWRRGGRRRRGALLAALRERLDTHPHGAAVVEIMLRRRFPVDARHNAKIGYEQLARWATARRRRRSTWIGNRALGGGRT